MHGHSYRLEVAIRGPLQTQGPASGMVEDFETIERIVDERVVARLDHQTLNDIVENPTAENVLLWIWQQLDGHLRGFEEAVLWETPAPVPCFAVECHPERKCHPERSRRTREVRHSDHFDFAQDKLRRRMTRISLQTCYN